MTYYNKMACTLVTAYYEIKSKFNKEQYLSWAEQFLQLKSPIVCFTEQNTAETIQQMRGDLPIHIIIMPFEELQMWQLYKDKWIEHYTMDPESNKHSPQLYALWAQKAFFVETAITVNPFSTSYFFWCDIGAFRTPIHQNVVNTFPTIRYLEPDRIILQALDNVEESDRMIKEDGIYGEVISEQWNELRLVGGLWGGGAKACLAWKEEYHTMLCHYFRVNRFAGKDQQVMFSTFMANRALANVVQCTNYTIDIWFFLHYLLSDMDEHYELNLSYLI
jgi:hypothetical protein